MSTELIARAQAGDGQAFGQLVDPYRRELLVHCYRMLGSVQDAEDAVQETMLAAWRGLPGFEGRSSLRTWLYKVATSRCLLTVRTSGRRPKTATPPPGVDLPDPSRLGTVTWLEPYPDAWLAGLADTAPSPEAGYTTGEAISLAFITALQLLPPRQSAVVILRDVLGFPAREVAGMLDATEGSVTSALKRARATLRRDLAATADEPPVAAGSVEERHLVDRLTRAYQVGDIDDVISLLTDDAWLAMPPLPLEYQGRELAARFLTAVSFPRGRTYRIVPTRANGQLALATYALTGGTTDARANGLLVFTLAGSRIRGMTRFDADVLPYFTLPGPPTTHQAD